jgi:O-antigen ligase
MREPLYSILAPLGLALALAVITGTVVARLGSMEMRWGVYATSFLLLLAVLVLVRDREKLLWTLLLLSLQVDVYVRFMYAHAGSRGIAFAFAGVMAAGLLIYWALSGRLRALRPWRWGGLLSWPIFAVFATMILAGALSSEHFIAVGALVLQAQIYLIYWLVLNGVRTEARFRQTLTLLLVCLVVQSLVYYVQSLLGFSFTLTGETEEPGLTRHGGTVATSPHGFINFILPPLFIATAYFLGRRPKPKLGLAWIAGGLGLVALVLSLTRAAWAAFGLGVALLALLGTRRRVLSVQKLFACCAVALVVAALAIPLIVARLEGAPLEQSYQERAYLMQMAMQVIEAHPLTGVGPGSYGVTYKRYISEDLLKRWQNTVHNHYLLRTAETGIPGGLALVTWLVAALVQALRLARSANPLFSTFGMAASATIAAAAFEMYWDMWTFFTTHAMFWVMLALTGAAEALDRERAAKVTPGAASVQHGHELVR